MGLIAIFNGLGRFIFGLVVDRLGRRPTMALLGSGFVICGLLLFHSLQYGNLQVLYLALVLCGLLYGGCMPCGTSMIGAYGLKHYQMNISLSILSMLPASFLGPYLSGLLYSGTNSYFSTAVLLVIFGVVAVLTPLMIKKP